MRKEVMPMLINSIREAQARKGWNDGEFAKQLGISHSVFSRIMSMQRPMGLRFLRAVAKLMPELKWQVAEYVLEGGNGTNGTSNGAKTGTTAH